ncbi:GIY-YIG nuclease family protein [Xanthomonas hyacinthi]|uniref:GIY-YIG nuclease family protein n=1 Tax=Xanthomonas hyacinthi TaxID=56455 RepID=UPI000A871F1A|nr:GIY-YIG nuclease family protein [Xanthomonas hyacinthi]QGY78872.1 GIY-YIG nuclease family protein [Xanthomonas hyacinthi]
MKDLLTSTIRSSPITIYVLALENGCYYVGQSCKFIERIAAHFQGKGSSWTKRNPPIAVLCAKTVRTCDWKVAERFENRLTLFMMSKHGWKNVRGGFWSNVCERSTSGGLMHHRKAHILHQPLNQEALSRAGWPKQTGAD